MTDIRQADATDQAAIRHLLRQLHTDRADAATLPVVRQDSRTFVAADADGVVGLIVATFVDYGVEAYGMIEELVVDEAHRGSGIGSALLEESRRWLVGQNAQVTFVSALDDAAVAFYAASGFARCTGPWLFSSEIHLTGAARPD